VSVTGNPRAELGVERLVTSRKRLLVGASTAALAAATAASVVLLADGHGEAERAHSKTSSPTQVPPAWSTYRDNERGLTLSHPPDWFVAPQNLTPHLGKANRPWEIVSLGTYKRLDPADHNCAHIPVNALENLGPGDAFISVLERRPPSHELTTPRPRRFGPNSGVDGNDTEVVDCLSVPPEAAIRWIPFAAAEREFYVIVAIGTDATPQRRAETYHMLDAMTIGAPSEGQQ
jgi:hypothetical protein